MNFNEDRLKKWKDSRILDKDGELTGIDIYVKEMWETVDEIRKSEMFGDKIIDISCITASGRKPRPSSYIYIVIQSRMENLPSTINGFDVEFSIEDEHNEENTIYVK